MNSRAFFPSLLLAVILLAAGCTDAPRKPDAAAALPPAEARIIGFYNMENLFDARHDPGKKDEDYLPDGQYAWTQDKYEKKLANMAHVIAEMAKENGRYHAVLGVAEIENDAVLKALVAQPEIAEAGYRFVHFESPDSRGIDVALLYRPDIVKVLESKPLKLDDRRTRSTLMVRAEIDGEAFAFYVAHLPSRQGEDAEKYRCRGAEIIYDHAMQLQRRWPGIKIVVMGDMNDNPSDKSLADRLHGREKPETVGEKDFFSPFWAMHKAGYGSQTYRGEWNIYDCILVNEALTHPAEGTFGILKIEKNKYYGKVFDAPFLTQQSGRYKGTPFRTFSGSRFINGYSDHYPTYIAIGK